MSRCSEFGVTKRGCAERCKWKEQEQLQLFEDQAIRTAWDANAEQWYFSIVDVVSVLTEQQDAIHLLGCFEEAPQR